MVLHNGNSIQFLDTLDSRALFLFTEEAMIGASQGSRVGIATLKGPEWSKIRGREIVERDRHLFKKASKN